MELILDKYCSYCGELKIKANHPCFSCELNDYYIKQTKIKYDNDYFGKDYIELYFLDERDNYQNNPL